MENAPAGGEDPGEQLLTPLVKFNGARMVAAGASSKAGVPSPLK
jgi:hypothetical protein